MHSRGPATMTIACHECDLLQRLPAIPPGGKARCARCGCHLVFRSTDPIERPLALTVAAVIVFLVAHLAPLMALSAVGRYAATTIGGGVYAMWEQGQPMTALIVAFCVIVAPGLYLVFMLVLLLGARHEPAPHWVGDLLRAATAMQPWSMNEVMVLGILVALIKIAELASVDPGVGMYAVGALVVLLAAIGVTFDADTLWERVRWAAR